MKSAAASARTGRSNIALASVYRTTCYFRNDKPRSAPDDASASPRALEFGFPGQW